MRSSLCTALVIASVGWASPWLTAPVTASLITGSQLVSDTRSSPAYSANNHNYAAVSWGFTYTSTFDGTGLHNDTQVLFFFDDNLNFSPAQQTAFIDARKVDVANQWNNKFVILDNATQSSYPITVELGTVGPPSQGITVHLGFPGDASDLNNWYSDDEHGVFAHETGHLLGLFDEYLGGAVDQFPNPTLTDVGLMGLGARQPHPVMFSRYYQPFLADMQRLNPGGSFSLLEVPEPATWLLLALGMMVLSAMRRGPAKTRRLSRS